MGNDGGSIPKRRELVKEAARLPTSAELKESTTERLEWRWSTCALSSNPLRPPVVSDCMGNLYNKDAILEFLLPSEDPAVEARKVESEKILEGRVRGLKDVVEVKFQEDEGEEAANEKVVATTTTTTAASKWICPVTNKRLGPSVKAVYIVPCGHAFSEVALREVAEDICLQCNEKYAPENIIAIIPATEADQLRLMKRIATLREQGLTHSLKKGSGGGKKRKKNTESTTVTADFIKTSATAAGPQLPPPPPPPASSSSSSSSTPITTSTKPSSSQSTSSSLKNQATASLTAKVLAEESLRQKRRKLEGNESYQSLFSSKTKEKDGKGTSSDFMTRGYSIPAGAKR